MTSRSETPDGIGTVYLIHFERPYKHARHYIGWASDLEGRLEHHRRGSGAVLMAVVTKAGIPWSVVKTWAGDRNFERKLKDQKNTPRFCPACMEARCESRQSTSSAAGTTPSASATSPPSSRRTAAG